MKAKFKEINIKAFRAYNMKALRIIFIVLAVAGIACPIFIYYRHSVSGPEDNHKNISHYQQRHLPRHEIRGFSFDSSQDGRRVISIKADRFSIKKKKLGFLSFGLMNEARFDNAIIHIYGREKTEVRGQRSEVGKRQRSEVRACPPSVWRGQRSEVGGQRVRREKDEHRTPAGLASESVAGRSNVQHRMLNEKKKRKAELVRRQSGGGQKNWSNGELVEWSSGSGFQPRKSVQFKSIFSKGALPSFQTKKISSIVMEPVCVELHDEQSSVTRISAASAVIRFKKRCILFKGNVRVVSGSRVLTTSRLSLFPEKAVIKTDQHFILKTPEKELKGDRLTSDIFLKISGLYSSSTSPFAKGD